MTTSPTVGYSSLPQNTPTPPTATPPQRPATAYAKRPSYPQLPWTFPISAGHHRNRDNEARTGGEMTAWWKKYWEHISIAVPWLWWLILIGLSGWFNHILVEYRLKKENVVQNGHYIHGLVGAQLIWIGVGRWRGWINSEMAMFLCFMVVELACLGIELSFSVE